MASLAHDAQLPLELRRIKRASKALVGAVGGTIDAADICKLRQQRVSECQLPNVPTFLPVDAVLSLEDEARGSDGFPQVTAAMARHHGFALMQLPSATLVEGSWHRSLAEVSREAGDVVGKIVNALADDGDVSAKEIISGRIVEEIDDAIARLADLKGLCAARLERGDG